MERFIKSLTQTFPKCLLLIHTIYLIIFHTLQSIYLKNSKFYSNFLVIIIFNFHG